MANAPHIPASADVYAVASSSTTAPVRNSMPPESTTYNVTRERVTIHNVPGSQLAPNLEALFRVSNTRSEGLPNYSGDLPPKYADVVK